MSTVQDKQVAKRQSRSAACPHIPRHLQGRAYMGLPSFTTEHTGLSEADQAGGESVHSRKNETSPDSSLAANQPAAGVALRASPAGPLREELQNSSRLLATHYSLITQSPPNTASWISDTGLSFQGSGHLQPFQLQVPLPSTNGTKSRLLSPQLLRTLKQKLAESMVETNGD